MSGLSTGIGLISNINFADVVDQLIQLERRPIRRLEQRVEGLQAEETALKSLEAKILTLAGAAGQLALQSTFESLKVNNPSSHFSVTAGEKAAAGTYHFQAVREARTQQARSNGFADFDQQPIGSGTLTIGSGGALRRPTELDALNGGAGVERGVIRITDRSGATADIDLSDAFTVDDVLRTVNQNSQISVQASAEGDHVVLTDTSGGTASDLIVSDLAGGRTAQDLGIAQQAAGGVLTGGSVYELTEAFSLSEINDGNAVRLFEGAPDVRFTLSDDSVIEVNLDGAGTLGQVIDKINNHQDNNGKLSAALVGGRLELTDLSGGGGTSSFSVEDINGGAVVRPLGLDVAAAGTQIAGRRLLAGINSVLLSNLRGGRGIDATGQLSLTDRTGATATIDLTGAESLDEVIGAINAATTGGGTKLQLTAQVNAAGTGIEVRDTSGAAASNLIIADVGGSTLAAQLGIAADTAESAVDSGSLNLRHVNESTDIGAYRPGTGNISPGSILVTDSAGNQATIQISEAVKTVGDVLLRINAAAGAGVRAELNDSGDGIVIVDEAGGAGTLKVEEAGGTTAADLRLLGPAVTGGDGKQRIEGRTSAVIDVEDGDTLEDLVQKINDAGGIVTASALDDGSAFSSARLVLTSVRSGSPGRFFVDDGGLDLGLQTLTEGRDALLRVGPDVRTGFLKKSESNRFDDAVTGLDVEILEPSGDIEEVVVARDTDRIESALQNFVDGYNQYVEQAAELTRFDPETTERGVLQGSGLVLRAGNRLQSLVTRELRGVDGPIQSLVDLGIRLGDGGKLRFDKQRLAEALQRDPEAVADFFRDEEAGFAQLAKQTIESLTDPLTGSFFREENALQQSVESLNSRIEQLDGLLESKRQRLLQEFINLENVLGQLTSQQQAITAIAPLQVNRVGTGILGRNG